MLGISIKIKVKIRRPHFKRYTSVYKPAGILVFGCFSVRILTMEVSRRVRQFVTLQLNKDINMKQNVSLAGPEKVREFHLIVNENVPTVYLHLARLQVEASP